MRMYVHVYEVLVKEKRRNKFTVSRAECSLVYHRVFGRSECLVDDSGIPLGALVAYCFAHIDCC